MANQIITQAQNTYKMKPRACVKLSRVMYCACDPGPAQQGTHLRRAHMPSLMSPSIYDLFTIIQNSK